MSDMMETHAPQGPTAETLARKPWKAPRLIDLEDDDTDGKMSGYSEFTGNNNYMIFDMNDGVVS